MRTSMILRGSIVALVVALAVFSSACGGGASPTGPSTVPIPSPEPVPPPAPEPTPEPEPTPSPSQEVKWSALPPLSAEAKEWVVRYNLNAPSSDPMHSTSEDASAKWFGVDDQRGVVKRWNKPIINVPADPWFTTQDVLDATNLWQGVLGGKVSFQVVSGGGGDMVLRHQDRLPGAGACRQSWIPNVMGGTILGGTYYSTYGSPIAMQLNCKEENRIWVAQAIGVLLGLGAGETPPDVDVMSRGQRPVWGISPLTSEVINWLYSVPPGTRPID